VVHGQRGRGNSQPGTIVGLVGHLTRMLCRKQGNSCNADVSLSPLCTIGGQKPWMCEAGI